MIVRRLLAALAPAGAAFLFGVALGERGELGFVQWVFLAVIPIAIVVIAWYAKKARREVMTIGTAIVIGLFVGQREFARAYDECVEQIHVVRDAINRYETERGEYPQRLTDLSIDLPCDCLLRDTILRYFSNERGYRLWFTNDRERITATEKSSGRSRTPRASTPPDTPAAERSTSVPARRSSPRAAHH